MKQLLLIFSLIFLALASTSLAYLCGGHEAPNCQRCPYDVVTGRYHGQNWCNGECIWSSKNMTCNSRFPVSTTTTTTSTTSLFVSTTPTTKFQFNSTSYCLLNENHTMCKFTGPSSSCDTIFSKISAKGKNAIVEKHNRLRRKVAKGQEKGQPPAANMKRMVWSEELAVIAQRWADQCTFSHDAVRYKLDNTSVGQNMALRWSSKYEKKNDVEDELPNFVQRWYDEVKDFDSNNIDPFKFTWHPVIGHYTQVVWADSEEIGCGSTYYKDDSNNMFTNLLVCNYGTAGNIRNAAMYGKGPSCSACPNGYNCQDALCSKSK